MTIHEAVATLTDALPDSSFLIELNLWSHKHGPRRMPLDIEWRIYDAVKRESVVAKTLDLAVASILAKASLSEVQAAVASDCPF